MSAAANAAGSTARVPHSLRFRDDITIFVWPAKAVRGVRCVESNPRGYLGSEARRFQIKHPPISLPVQKATRGVSPETADTADGCEASANLGDGNVDDPKRNASTRSAS